LVGGVLILIGLFFFFRHPERTLYFICPGGVLIALGMFWPAILRYAYIAWMSLAFALGFIMAHLILTVFFYLVVTPIGLIARLAGKDFLSLKLDRHATSYWIARENKDKSAIDYERQF
jgi:hypothetical protein